MLIDGIIFTAGVIFGNVLIQKLYYKKSWKYSFLHGAVSGAVALLFFIIVFSIIKVR